MRTGHHGRSVGLSEGHRDRDRVGWFRAQLCDLTKKNSQRLVEVTRLSLKCASLGDEVPEWGEGDICNRHHRNV
jgi:hypothetical protein